MEIAGPLGESTSHALGLMALRSLTIGAKFALTVFIARYLGLADLGIYGLIASAAVVTPVLLGFGVSNNLGRDAAREGPAAVATRLLQYFIVILPLYFSACAVGLVWFSGRHATLLGVLCLLLILEHVQTDMFSVMAMTGRLYRANLVNFVRSSGWVLVYVPLALFQPQLRTVEAVSVAWLAGCIVATALTVLFTAEWRWREAVAALPSASLALPHRHGSTALYFNDVANTLFQYVDRYVIGIFLSPELLGIYVLFWSITNAISNLVTTAIVQSRKGILVMVAKSERHFFNDRLRDVALVTSWSSVALSAVAILLVYVLAGHLGRPEIIPYLPLMFMLSAGLVLRAIYEVLGIAFYAFGRDDISLYSGFVILVAALALNLALDPVFGLWGAGAALVASYVAGGAARALIIARGFRPRALPQTAGAA